MSLNPGGLKAQSADSIDVESYKLSLDLTGFKTRFITGVADIKCKPVFGKPVKTIRFWLLKLQVDSVFIKDVDSLQFRKVGFNYNDTFLRINRTLNKLADVKIYYKGYPVKDASWGGFYFSGEYAFNMGVAFTSYPHNYGRVWFPCIDNFTDKAAYRYSVKVLPGYAALCGGNILDTVINADNTVTWNWDQPVPIPTYLASVAMAPYRLIFDDYSGIKRNIPIILAAEAKDVANLQLSFVNLKNAMEVFEEFYGPYIFERIGYSLVPFGSGAMEHACNIAYPMYGADSKLTYETVMAHELSHHWWGNNTTCSTAGDMWLNEGWAAFSEALFVEKVYGKKAYQDYVNNVHKNVLQFSHLLDGAATAVNNVSHQNTYGNHVYKKGADMVHCIRGAMGDKLFIEKCQSLMETYKLSNISTGDFINHFNYQTGLPANYISQIISDTGFCHFSIFKSTTAKEGSGWKIDLTYTQRKRFGHHVYNEMPYEVFAFDKNFKREVFKFNLGNTKSLSFKTNLKPEFICFDYDQKFSDAITDDVVITPATGTFDLKNAMMNLVVNSSSDTSLIRVEHNWVYPDAYFMNIPNTIISKERYWTVDGIFDPGFKASATINYDGSKPGSFASGWLDNQLLEGRSEDSIVLLYRPNAESNWQIEANMVKTIGARVDKKGSIKINDLKKGQYAFGVQGKIVTSGINEKEPDYKMKLFPNPTNEKLNLKWITGLNPTEIDITGMDGMRILSKRVVPQKTEEEFDTQGLANGTYLVSLILNDLIICSREFIIAR